jgi:hypothetical protein
VFREKINLLVYIKQILVNVGERSVIQLGQIEKNAIPVLIDVDIVLFKYAKYLNLIRPMKTLDFVFYLSERHNSR